MASESKPQFPLANQTQDGWSTETEATATCFCGAVQLVFPTQGPGLVKTFVCHCTDCHKITASMFASNFVVDDAYLKHVRGKDKLKTWSQSKTIASGNTMTNYFCSTCGTLMYRVSSGFPGKSITRIGTIDDFHLIENKLAPTIEQFVKSRVSWLSDVKRAQQFENSGI
ncbi:hypothetical protein M406DRAFT_264365 [Cryphonectria parasitica EP155]|uniref:CENP-V/GFA domain-containing protein n=1 Tax=Cryphonectria parasitica (strain ATCC 38755 / EP155) TaxID=660469 RepID=A0A9P5CL90_CRYP1|nr:uncharacterized protein M406DRAFT_264365 [Cryphonectria parasitica EP155]KAF3762828.1 hypothetical protein M406DRAFT_264365 [Cryphonectria parasitica EP155]